MTDKRKENLDMKLIFFLIFLIAELILFILSITDPAYYLFYLIFINVLILTIGIPLLYLIYLVRQVEYSNKYYEKLIEDNYNELDEKSLTKMFEIRITNYRTFVFSYLLIALSYTITVAFDDKAYKYFDISPVPGGAKFFIGLGVIAVFSMVYFTMGMDRYTLEEFNSLIKAKRKLNELKKNKN